MSSEKMDSNEDPEKTDVEIASDGSKSLSPMNSALFDAIEAGNYEDFKACFDELAGKISARELANSTNPSGVSLLHFAVTYDRYEIAVFLMFNGSDPDCKTPIGITPLYMATYDNPNSFQMVSLLLSKGCDKNAKSIYGHFPLYNAIEQRNVEVAKLLIESGADTNAVVTEDGGETALHIAAKYDDDDIALELINRGADINAKTDQNETPVSIATLNNSEKVLKLLMEHHARTDTKTDDDQFPFDIAVEAPMEKIEESPSNKRTPLFVTTAVCLTLVVLALYLIFPPGKNKISQKQRVQNGPAVESTIIVKAIVYDPAAEPKPEEESVEPAPEQVPEPVSEPVQESVPVPVQKLVQESVPESNPEPVPETLPEPVMEPVVSSDRPFHLIVGSFKEPDNADRLMERLKRSGFNDCTTLPWGLMTLVSIESFPEKIEAEVRKKEILNSYKFESWILTRNRVINEIKK